MTDVARDALMEAVRAAGGQARLARAVGVTVQAVHQWLNKGRVPVERASKVAEVTGVSKHRLRQDIFGPAPERHEQEANECEAVAG